MATSDMLHAYVVSRASDVPPFAWTALRSKEVDANTILPPLLKCWAMEQEGSVTPDQLWIIIYASSQQAEIKLIASCTDGPTGNYPIFIFTPIPTQHIEREKTILFVGLSIIVRELLQGGQKTRLFRFCLGKVIKNIRLTLDGSHENPGAPSSILRRKDQLPYGRNLQEERPTPTPQ